MLTLHLTFNLCNCGKKEAFGLDFILKILKKFPNLFKKWR